MKSKITIYSFILLVFLFASDMYAGGDDDSPGPLLGVSYGGFTSLHSGFDDIYINTSSPVEYIFGVGYKKIYLIGKYKKYSASGQSIVKNADYRGNADYNQDFFMFGLRFYDHNDRKMRFFLEFGAVSSLVKESISTENRIPELASSLEQQEWGFELSVGGTLMINNFAGINGAIEYTRIIYDGGEGIESGDVSLGGLYLSIGVVFMPFSY